jgi:hypothetical protein
VLTGAVYHGLISRPRRRHRGVGILLWKDKQRASLDYRRKSSGAGFIRGGLHPGSV